MYMGVRSQQNQGFIESKFCEQGTERIWPEVCLLGCAAVPGLEACVVKTSEIGCEEARSSLSLRERVPLARHVVRTHRNPTGKK
eukprot:1484116-Amphidinium_carterae.2